jgi:hypothetical protein
MVAFLGVTLTDDRPTLAERYVSAISSKNLKINDEHPLKGDVGLLIACGKSGDTIGSELMRLRAEFDVVKADLKGTAGNPETEMLLALMHLKSLPSARNRLAAWGTNRAAFKGYNAKPQELAKLIGRVLDIWLSPACYPCEGRGFTGGGRGEHSGPRMRCGVCGETGKRKQRLGKDDAERAFAGDMLVHMDRMVAGVEAEMSRFLRNGA